MQNRNNRVSVCPQCACSQFYIVRHDEPQECRRPSNRCSWIMCQGRVFEIHLASPPSITCTTCHKPRLMKDIGRLSKNHRAEFECSICGARYGYRDLAKKGRLVKVARDDQPTKTSAHGPPVTLVNRHEWPLLSSGL